MIFSQKTCLTDNNSDSYGSFCVGPWGEGIVNEGIAFSHSRPKWDSLDDDELIFYTPFLISDEQTPERVERLKLQLNKAISCKLWWSAQSLKQVAPPDWTLDQFKAKLGKTFNGIGNFENLINIGAKNAHTWFGRAQLVKLKKKPFFNFKNFGKKIHSKDFEIYEMSEIETLKILARCIKRIESDPHNLTGLQDISLPELGLAAIHTGINPVYFTKGCAFLHETLSIACWTGFLLRGRSAYLSAEIASKLKQILCSFTSTAYSLKNSLSESRMLDERIVSHVKLVCDVDELQKSIDQCVEGFSVVLIQSKVHNPKDVFSRHSMLKGTNKHFREQVYDLQVAV